MQRRALAREQPAEVDDARDPRAGGRAGEVARRDPIALVERDGLAGGALHRVNQVIGDVDPGERGGEPLAGERVAMEDLDLAGDGVEGVMGLAANEDGETRARRPRPALDASAADTRAGSRPSARTVCPPESRRGTSSEPAKPEAPVTRMRITDR